MPRQNLVTYTAWSIPVAVLGQFLLAGLSLFHDAQLWAGHGILGSVLAILIGIVAVVAFVDGDASHLRPHATVLVTIYVIQVVLIIVGQNTGSDILQALHVFNASLVLLTSFVFAQKAGGFLKGAPLAVPRRKHLTHSLS
jgi:hypothetical protein